MLPNAVPALLARFTRRRQRTVRAQEPADMGTAYGMEQWLVERDHHGAAAATPSNPAKAGPGWLPRWLKPGGAGGERA